MSALQCGELGGNLALGVEESSQYENIWQESGTMTTLIMMMMVAIVVVVVVMMAMMMPTVSTEVALSKEDPVAWVIVV